MDTKDNDKSIVLDDNGNEIEVSAYVLERLKERELLYFKYLIKYQADTFKAYKSVFPDTLDVNAKKNKSKFDRKVRAKIEVEYQKLKDMVSKKAPTIEESKYTQALVKNGGDRKKAALEARPDTMPSSSYKIALRIEGQLSAKDPAWRQKLTEAYHPGVYFENIDSMAMGYNPNSNTPVKDDIMLKANLDMLNIQGFATKADPQLEDRIKRMELNGGVIKNILNLQVNNYNGDNDGA